MSIEKELDRIATALEVIAVYATPNVKTEVNVSESLEELAKKLPEVESEKEEELKIPFVALSVKELNELLKIENERLGGDQNIILGIIKEHGASSLNSLDPEKYQKVLTKVRQYKK